MRQLASWIEEYSDEDSLTVIKELALHHARLGGTEGERIVSCITNDDYRSLCDWDLTYDYNTPPHHILHCRQSLAFFSKARFLDLGIDKEAVSREKFLLAEAECQLTNQAFRCWARGDFCFPRGVDSILYAASRKIARILGPVPDISMLRLRFGPGATTSTKKRNASPREKLGAKLACSEDLLPVLTELLEEMPGLLSIYSIDEDRALVPVEVTTGVVGFVPKTAKTHRAIVTEPVLNGMLQLGIGDYITARLAAVGLDLSDQTKNQRLAREGSLTGALATLDLSSASDTISNELVWHLLPFEWAEFLSFTRSAKVKLGDTVIHQEKFSSMGNGFTFPLESLIFYALTEACCEGYGSYTVYGDDIICPSSRVQLLMLVLRCCGFTVNSKKSFWEGCFRESCGADYFRGFDVRPYYQKNLVSPASLFVLHNFYVRRQMSEEAAMVLTYIHPALRIFGPDGYGDGHLLGKWTPRRPKQSGWSGFLFDTFTLKNRRDIRPAVPGDAVLPAYSVYASGSYPTPRAGELHRLHGPLYNEIRDNRGDSRVIPGSRGYKRISIYTLTPSE